MVCLLLPLPLQDYARTHTAQVSCELLPHPPYSFDLALDSPPPLFGPIKEAWHRTIGTPGAVLAVRAFAVTFLVFPFMLIKTRRFCNYCRILLFIRNNISDGSILKVNIGSQNTHGKEKVK